MNAGDLDRTISIERKTVTRDSIGGESASWSTLHSNVSANKRTISGREVVSAQRILAAETAMWTIRFVSGITAKDRINESGTIWNILALREVERAHWLEITAESTT